MNYDKKLPRGYMSEQLANWNTERDPYDNHAEVRHSMNNNRRQADPYRMQTQQNQEIITNSYTAQMDASIDDVFQDMEQEQQEEQYQSGVMFEAQARIEQANLYQTLLNHDLFGPGSARQNILEKVQAEVKEFVLIRLEELLGMKSSAKEVAFALPFDEEEVSALKALATKVLKRDVGQSFTPEVRQVQTVRTVTTPPPHQVTLPANNQIAKPTPRPVTKAPVKPATKAVVKSEPKKPTGPVKPLTPEEMATMTPERAAELVASRQTKKAATTGRGKPALTIEQLQRVEQEQAQRAAMNLSSVGGGGNDALLTKAIAASLK
jgi:hypothetical protein